MTGYPAPILTASDRQFRVEAYEKIEYSLLYVDGAFAVENPELAERYRPFGRCLMVVDETVLNLYGARIQAYFEHYQIALTAFPVVSGRPTRAFGPSSRWWTPSAGSVCCGRNRCWSSGAG